MHEGSITIRFGADLQEIERLNRIIRHFGELHEIPGRTLYAINLAIDELVTNVILYGYDEPRGEEVIVRIETAGQELHAWIRDGGRHFNPLEVASPKLDAPLSERALGGLGIHLVRNLMDHVEYGRVDGKNVLTLRKRIR